MSKKGLQPKFKIGQDVYLIKKFKIGESTRFSKPKTMYFYSPLPIIVEIKNIEGSISYNKSGSSVEFEYEFTNLKEDFEEKFIFATSDEAQDEANRLTKELLKEFSDD